MRLEVRLRHTFESGYALDLDFATEHRTTALFGPSGAGKTSLLMAIAGLLRPDEGRIVWAERVLLDTEAGIFVPAEGRRLGVVFQDQRLFPHLTVDANLRFGERRMPSGATPPPLERIVEVLDLANLLGRRPATLSGGERQRIALGRALMCAPKLLLLDEPVAAVDEPRRNVILGYVDRVVHEWDLPMLYVSHHRAEVQRLADWVIAVEAGSVVQEGPADHVLGAGELVAAGEPVNLLRLEQPSETDDGAWLARLPGTEGGVTVRLPSGATSLADPTYVQFAASDVMIARGEVAGLSARNRLPARVVELVPRAGRVFVAVAVADQRLWAEVTHDAVVDLGLSAGEDVTCLIKSAALQVVE